MRPTTAPTPPPRTTTRATPTERVTDFHSNHIYTWRLWCLVFLAVESSSILFPVLVLVALLLLPIFFSFSAAMHARDVYGRVYVYVRMNVCIRKRNPPSFCSCLPACLKELSPYSLAPLALLAPLPVCPPCRYALPCPALPMPCWSLLIVADRINTRTTRLHAHTHA